MGIRAKYLYYTSCGRNVNVYCDHSETIFLGDVDILCGSFDAVVIYYYILKKFIC